MGEEQQPAKNEVERALASMSAGFHSSSDQIAAGIASLQDYMAEAPGEERERLREAIVQIVATQARLKGQVERLPAPSWDRFKSMVSILKTQQTVLDEVSLLVKEYVLPRQLQTLQAASLAAEQPAPPPEPEPPPPVSTAVARRPPPRRPAPSEPDDEPAPSSLFARARERAGTAFRGLLAMAIAGLALSLLPRDTKLVDLGSAIIDWVASERPMPSTATAKAEPQAPPAAAKRSEQRAPADPASKVAAVAPERPAPKVPSEPERLAAAAPPPAPAAAPPAAPRQEQFVPVVFTHQDHDTAMRALADLKQQFPTLMIGRKGEVQPVDLGKKGIWHRLVVLPAGPRPQATKLCDQLAAEGYDRCWVKAY
jgi:hypothetical protein